MVKLCIKNFRSGDRGKLNGLEDLILPSDLPHLLKDDLKNICLNLNIPADGGNAALAERQTLKSWVTSRLFAGKTAIVWFRPSNVELLKNLPEALTNYSGFDFLQATQYPDKVTTEPQ